MRPAADATSSCSTGSRKSSSSKKRLRPHLNDVLAPSPTSSSITGSTSTRTPAATAAPPVVLNMGIGATGTSAPKDQVTGSSAGSSGHNNKQQSHSGSNGSTTFSSPFGRFSLRRLLNPVNLTRTAMATTAAAVSSGSGRTPSSTRTIPAIDSVGDAVRTGRSSLCQYSSYDFDTNSVSSMNKNGTSGATVAAAVVTSSSSEDHQHQHRHHHSHSHHSSGSSGAASAAGHTSLKQLSRDRSRHHSTSSGSRKFSCVIQVSGSHAGRDNCSSSHRECPLCLLELPDEFFPDLCTCEHRACYDCLQQYLKIEISESRVMITCPECTEMIHPNDIRMILNDESFTLKYEKFMLRRVLVAEPDARWCPAPDCGFVVIASGCAGCPKLQCHRPGCDTDFCYHCKQQWHPNQTCDAARAQRSMGQRGSADELEAGHHHPKDTDIKPCPTCKVLIIKMDDGSCNHMTCSVCGTEFCWLCMKQISDLHYLSPSGCTFWGKKPWSRKKKILWQLGMLVGAPVGIALIAGIAVPAIVIGIPVWVGRKLHARLLKRETMARKNKNAIVATGVVASVCVSPILALVAVGIGIPILLAYVYGVVPISLCRSGGCGVEAGPTPSTSRVQVSEEGNEMADMHRPAPDQMSVDTALSNKVNPSIGEMSLGMSASLSMGSGSHLDRVTCDRESASNAPLAGSIASATPSNRLEVQADVSPTKRCSISSETASCGVSLSERLSHSCPLDDGTGSVCACAGSISSRAAVPVATHPVNESTSNHKLDATSHSGGQQLQPKAQIPPQAETQCLTEVVIVVPAATPVYNGTPVQSSSRPSLENKLVADVRT